MASYPFDPNRALIIAHPEESQLFTEFRVGEVEVVNVDAVLPLNKCGVKIETSLAEQ